MKIAASRCAALVASFFLSFSAVASVIAPGAELQKLAGDCKFTEGPASDRKGEVFFTDQPNNRILKWSLNGTVSTYMQPCGRANGLCFDSRGNLWACADEKNELWRISAKGSVTVVLRDFEGKLFNGPNDLWMDARDNLYFTDPFYKRDYWKRGASEMPQCVYFLGRRQKTPTRLIADLKQPNGIIGTRDGKKLYVADIGDSKTYSYTIESAGVVKDRKLFCLSGSDGMTIDDEGNVYLTGKGVLVYNPSGQMIHHIQVPEPWTANVCFGGKDHSTLFITASKGLYALKMSVKGTGSQ